MPDSLHFHLSEMVCKDGTPYPQEWELTRWPDLARLLEGIRHYAADDLPVTLVCGYRSPAYNERLRKLGLSGESGRTGVAEHSHHCEGRAADILVYGMPTIDLHYRIGEQHRLGHLPELGGLGLYRAHGFVHVDTYRLASGKLRRWGA